MTKRKSKKPQLEDAAVLLDTPALVKPKRRINSYVSPALLCVVALTLGASVLAWFCVQQQQSIDELSESFTTIQQRVSNFQKVMEIPDEQTDDDLSVEERIFALEAAQKQAQEKAEAAMATSEKVKNSDLYPQLVALHTEMNTRWDEMKQAALSVTTLQGMFKNKSDELEVMKEKVVAGLGSGSALSHTVDGLTKACSHVAERVASVDALNAQLEAQASLLNDLRGLLYLHSVALQAHNQEMAAIKKAVKKKQAMRAQALEEMLNLVRMTLNEQFSTSQNLHSSVLSQLQTFEAQLVNGPAWPLKKKTSVEELISPTAQSASEEQETMEDQAEQDVVEDETAEEEQAVEQEVEADDAEEVETDVTEEEEITEQSEEQEDGDEEEEVEEETIEDDMSDESLEEEVAEEAAED